LSVAETGRWGATFIFAFGSHPTPAPLPIQRWHTGGRWGGWRCAAGLVARMAIEAGAAEVLVQEAHAQELLH